MSKTATDKSFELDLAGIDGNAWYLMAEFGRQARRAKWTRAEIDKTCEFARAGDYDNLIYVLCISASNGKPTEGRSL